MILILTITELQKLTINHQKIIIVKFLIKGIVNQIGCMPALALACVDDFSAHTLPTKNNHLFLYKM